jgi:hypothetical protein
MGGITLLRALPPIFFLFFRSSGKQWVPNTHTLAFFFFFVHGFAQESNMQTSAGDFVFFPLCAQAPTVGISSFFQGRASGSRASGSRAGGSRARQAVRPPILAQFWVQGCAGRELGVRPAGRPPILAQFSGQGCAGRELGVRPAVMGGHGRPFLPRPAPVMVRNFAKFGTHDFFFSPRSGPTVANNNVFGCILFFSFSLGLGGRQRVTC